MKRLIKLIRCKILGHKWRIVYVYSSMRAHVKCDICESTKDGYIDEFVKFDL
jgi:hypothetical protein